MILRVSLGLYVQGRASPPVLMDVPLLPSFSHIVLERLHLYFNRFFLSLLTYLPDFCSERSNTDKLQITSQMQKKTKKHSKHLKMTHFDISFQTIIFI